MKCLHWSSGAILLGAALLLVGLLNSCSTVTRTIVAPPEIPGATFVGNQACYDCHTNITRAFTASPHARIHVEGAAMRNQSGCESCHGPGSKHIEAGGGRGQFIVNPRKDSMACFQCHLQTHAEFNLPHHHPVIEGRMNCVQCHDPHGADIFKPAGGLAMARQNESCAECHREQTRPFVFEHEALREGCTVCHNPHGSMNRKMLVESDPNLCLKCHAQVQHAGTGEIFIGTVRHTLLLRQGTCWSAGCHTAVHGSNVHPKMFY
jgi:predicted CXXCH cytochrome family protein